jgi:hypothetical protein
MCLRQDHEEGEGNKVKLFPDSRNRLPRWCLRFDPPGLFLFMR